MRVGLVLPIAHDEWLTAAPTYAEIREIAVGAEAAGFDSLWVYDHLLFRFPDEPEAGHP